jgi:excisionase family DNA binding protein
VNPGKEKATPLAWSDTSEIMTTREVANYLNCHYSTIFRLVRDGVLPVFRLGGDYRFLRSEINRWIVERQVSPSEKPKPFYGTRERQKPATQLRKSRRP